MATRPGGPVATAAASHRLREGKTPRTRRRRPAGGGGIDTRLGDAGPSRFPPDRLDDDRRATKESPLGVPSVTAPVNGMAVAVKTPQTRAR